MKRLLLLLALPLVGCASFKTVQRDVETPTAVVGANGRTNMVVVRTTTTEATASSLMAGKNALDGWKASQSGRTQGASIKALAQESNAEPLMSAIGALLLKGLLASGGGGLDPSLLQALQPQAAAPVVAPEVRPAEKALPRGTVVPRIYPK